MAGLDTIYFNRLKVTDQNWDLIGASYVRVPAPVSNTDACTKLYADTVAGGAPLETVLGVGNISNGTNLIMTVGDILTTDTINETGSGTGVTVEGVLIKDSGITLVNAITEFSTDGTLAGDSDTAVPTEKATKLYVDTQVATVDTWGEVLANGNTSGATDAIITAGQKITTDTIDETTATAGVTIDGTLIKDGVVTADLVGNSSTATALATARTIGGTSFDGTANIKIGALNSTNIDATTSAELAGVISDETGGGALVFGTSPALTTPTGIVATDIAITDTEEYYTSTDVEGALEELGELNSKNGYDLQDSTSLPDLAFNNGTRVFTVSVKSGSSNFSFWTTGKKVVKTTSQTVTVDNTTGTYYIYFDADGTLQSVEQSAIPSAAFYEYAITGLVYYNVTAGTSFVGNELHGYRMSSATHQYNHLTYGARYEDGIGVTGFVDGTTTFTGTTSGYFWDEDIRHIIALQATAPFIYKFGVGGEWTATTPDNLYGFENGTADVVYNENDGGDWKLTQSAAATDYMIYFIIATPDTGDYPVKKIIGQNGYSSRNNARDAIETERNNIITDGLPSPEYIFLFAYIVKRNGDLEEMDTDGGLYLDLRTVKGGTSGTGGVGSIASDVSVDTTNFDGILSATDVDVQTALETIDDLTDITGNAGTVTTITGLAPDTATTQATQANITTTANLTTVGALNAGSITSGFTSIDVGAGAIDGGVITADTNFAGALTGNVTGNCSGSAGTVTTITGLAPDTQNTYARTQYLIPYQATTTSFGEIAIGTDGQVLTSGGAGVAPSFEDASGTGDLKADGTIPLTANWDVGAYTITGTQFVSDIATGTAPLVVASTTEVANLKSATVSTITGLAPDTATTQATQASITSAANLVTVGTIGTGVWQGTDIAVGYLDGSSGTNAQVLTTDGTDASWQDATGDVTLTGTETLTNKRITERVKTFTSDATPDIDSDDYDAVTITAQDAAITDVNMSGTETNFQKILFRIKDDGTARAIAWGSDFEDAGAVLPTTTVISKLLTVGFIYNTVTSKWGCVAVANET